MIAPLTANNWIEIAHSAIELGTLLGVWKLAGKWGKRGAKVAKAVSHAPEMLHEHPETSGVLTAEKISYPFRETAG